MLQFRIPPPSRSVWRSHVTDLGYAAVNVRLRAGSVTAGGARIAANEAAMSRHGAFRSTHGWFCSHVNKAALLGRRHIDGDGRLSPSTCKGTQPFRSAASMRIGDESGWHWPPPLSILKCG